MDVNSETAGSSKSPLLGSNGSEGRKLGGSGGRHFCRRLSSKYSVNSLRRDFVARLPDKVRHHVDVESPSYDIDLSRTTGLSQGCFLDLD